MSAIFALILFIHEDGERWCLFTCRWLLGATYFFLVSMTGSGFSVGFSASVERSGWTFGFSASGWTFGFSASVERSGGSALVGSGVVFFGFSVFCSRCVHESSSCEELSALVGSGVVFLWLFCFLVLVVFTRVLSAENPRLDFFLPNESPRHTTSFL